MRGASRCLAACGGHSGILNSSGFNRNLNPRRFSLGRLGSPCGADSRENQVQDRSGALSDWIETDSMRRGCCFRRFSWFVSDSMGSGPSRDLRYLRKGHELFSSSTDEMTAKPGSGGGKQLKNDMVKKESTDKQTTDMVILRTLAKYLWLKDNAEFSFRVAMALGLLVGAKDFNNVPSEYPPIIGIL